MSTDMINIPIDQINFTGDVEASAVAGTPTALARVGVSGGSVAEGDVSPLGIGSGQNTGHHR